MAQVKKDEVRNRILESAERLFQGNGYIGTTINQIAKESELASSTIYVYFPSKLSIIFAIIEPWLLAQVRLTEREAAKIEDAHERLEFVFWRFWHDIPLARDNYMNNLLQALAVSTDSDNYQPTILNMLSQHMQKLITECLPVDRRDRFDANSIAQLAVFAFDGFVINHHLNSALVNDRKITKVICEMILGESSSKAAHPTSKRPTAPSTKRHKQDT